MQIYKVREFVTGKLMGTFLDSMTLVFLLPFLFWLNPTLSWMVVVAAGHDRRDHHDLPEADRPDRR